MKSNKLRGLQQLSDLGFPVPPFRALPDFESLPGGITCASDLTADWAALQVAVGCAMAEIECRAQYGFSLRSAASDEDGVHASLAGRYLSLNGLRSLRDVCEAAVKIWRHHRLVAPPGGTCQLILQATHCCYFGGVLAMGSRPGQPETSSVSCSIEAFYGSCRSIVDGLVAPCRSQLAGGRWRHTFGSEVTKSRFVAHAGLFEAAAGSVRAGEHLAPLAYPFPRQVRVYRAPGGLELEVYGYRPPGPPDWYVTAACQRLVEIATVLDSGDGVDMEWGALATGELAIYQVRPLTKPVPTADSEPTERSNVILRRHDEGSRVPVGRDPSPELAKDRAGSPQDDCRVLSGLPASPGTARGRLAAPGTHDPGHDRILFLGDASVCDAKSLEACAGVVTAFGGLLSHVAIACRELGIPCVVGIGAALPADAEVELDGDRGLVRLVG